MARPTDAKTPDKAPDKDAKSTAKPARKSRKLLFVAMAVVLLGGAGGGGAWWWMSRDAGSAQAKAAPTRPPVFMNLDPFTVNLLEEDGEHYLQTSVVFQVADEK